MSVWWQGNTPWWRDRLHFGGGLNGSEETGYLADLSRARVTQGLIVFRGRKNSRDQMLIWGPAHRLVLSHSQSIFGHVTQTGGENVLGDETNQPKRTVAKESTIFTHNYLDNSDNRPHTCFWLYFR